MDKLQVGLLLAAGVVCLIVSIGVRAKFGEKYEMKTTDLVLIILPLLLAAIVTGKLTMLDAFGVKADLSAIFVGAAESTIEPQLRGEGPPGLDDVLTLLQTDSKQSVDKIPQLIKNKTQALVFQLGYHGYRANAIQAYFDELYASSYLQYFVITDDQGKLFGVYNVLDLAVYFRKDGFNTYRRFTEWLVKADAPALTELKALPGFIDADMAVAKSLSKREVLKKMERAHLDRLPVIDENRIFVGTVERAQLTASLILEVVAELEQGANKNRTVTN